MLVMSMFFKITQDPSGNCTDGAHPPCHLSFHSATHLSATAEHSAPYGFHGSYTFGRFELWQLCVAESAGGQEDEVPFDIKKYYSYI